MKTPPQPDAGQWPRVYRGPYKVSNELTVSSSTYTHIQPGDIVNIHFRKGALGTGWYYMNSWNRSR